MKNVTAGLALGLLTSTAIATNAVAATPSVEEMWQIIQQQQAEIQRLKAQVANTDEEVKLTSEKVEATATVVEESLSAASTSGIGGRAGKTTIGNYGELHYNNLDNQNGEGGDKDEIDFHRFVFFLGHEFSEKTRFFSEIELEHSLVKSDDSNGGEVELEQAYIEHDLNSTTQLRAGLFLLPIGLLNITHEPDTFYGVERNNVEKEIIPTTWWEAGAAVGGELAPGWNYEASYTSGLGLDANAGDYKIRSGRQKVSNADASDPAYTASLRFTGMAGLELGASLHYQSDLFQGEYSEEVDALLVSAHLAYTHGAFGLRALAATWDIDSNINAIKDGADTQEGWYIEPSYRVLPKLGVFTRYSEWDNQAGGGGDTEFSQWDIGLNYWLEDNVVFKIDYQFQDAPDNQKELEGFNLGVGWSL